MLKVWRKQVETDIFDYVAEEDNRYATWQNRNIVYQDAVIQCAQNTKLESIGEMVYTAGKVFEFLNDRSKWECIFGEGVEKVSSCTCSSFDLFNFGCKCGYLKKT